MIVTIGMEIAMERGRFLGHARTDLLVILSAPIFTYCIYTTATGTEGQVCFTVVPFRVLNLFCDKVKRVPA